jgi:hypothetical protein
MPANRVHRRKDKEKPLTRGGMELMANPTW